MMGTLRYVDSCEEGHIDTYTHSQSLLFEHYYIVLTLHFSPRTRMSQQQILKTC